MAGRRPRRWPGPSLELRRGAGAVLVGLCLALLAPTTWAQDRIEGDVSVQRFNPAPGLRNFITTRSARTDGEMVWTAGGFVHYGYRPFELRRCPETPGGCDAAPNVEVQEFRVVENMVTGEAVGSFTPIPELQIGGRLPVTWVRGHGTEAVEAGGLSAVGVGDLELEAKGRLLGDVESPWAAGVAAYVTAPLGTLSAGGSYIGDDTASVGARGIVDGKAGPLTWGVNLGGSGAGRRRSATHVWVRSCATVRPSRTP